MSDRKTEFEPNYLVDDFYLGLAVGGVNTLIAIALALAFVII